MSLLALAASSTLAWPGLRMAGTFRRPPLPPPSWGPLFILGHYRSGTTLLHKLLASDPRFAALSTFDLLFPGLPHSAASCLRPPLQWLVDVLDIEQGYFHEARLRLDDPNETEGWLLSAGSPWSSYWGFVFLQQPDLLERYVRFAQEEERERWARAYGAVLDRLRRRHPDRRLVVKDPPNTGRVRLLLERYPAARFVYLYRDPSDVVRSMRRLWRETVESRFGVQPVGDEERCTTIMGHYDLLVSRYLRDRDRLPADRLVELRYEAFVEDPLGHVRRVYDRLGIEGWATARASLERRLHEDERYSPAPLHEEPPLPPPIRDRVQEWRERLGYVAGAGP